MLLTLIKGTASLQNSRLHPLLIHAAQGKRQGEYEHGLEPMQQLQQSMKRQSTLQQMLLQGDRCST
jgi:hypothetical protein